MLHRQTTVQSLVPGGQGGGAPPVNAPPAQASVPAAQPQPGVSSHSISFCLQQSPLLFVTFIAPLIINFPQVNVNDQTKSHIERNVIYSASTDCCVNYLFVCHQPGMHVNGAPQMMQPPNMGVVPGSMPVPGPGPGQGPVPVGPQGDHQTAILLLSVKLVLVSFLIYWHR